jgi:hypothetical protein
VLGVRRIQQQCRRQPAGRAPQLDTDAATVVQIAHTSTTVQVGSHDESAHNTSRGPLPFTGAGSGTLLAGGLVLLLLGGSLCASTRRRRA